MSLPDAQFEEKEPCEIKECPVDEWLVRLRFLLHRHIDDGEVSEALATRIAEVLTDHDDPLAVAEACFRIQHVAWRRFKQQVESGEIKPIVN